MEVLEEFVDELATIEGFDLPVSEEMIQRLAQFSIIAVQKYKEVVQNLETYSARCDTKLLLSIVYIVDSIVRQSRACFGTDNDLYGPEFRKYLPIIAHKLLNFCSPDDRQKFVKVINLWQKDKIFSSETIQALLCTANSKSPPNISLPKDAESTAYIDEKTEFEILLESNMQKGSSLNFETFISDEHEVQHSFTNSKSSINDQMENSNKTIENKSKKDVINLKEKNLLVDESFKRSRSTELEPGEIDERPNISSNKQIRVNLSKSLGKIPQRFSNLRRSTDTFIEGYSPHLMNDQYTPPKNVLPLNFLAQSTQSAIEPFQFPPSKRNCLTICSTTIWIGSLPKKITHSDLNNIFGKYGRITRIYLPQNQTGGWAYVSFQTRVNADAAFWAIRNGMVAIPGLRVDWSHGYGLCSNAYIKNYFCRDIGCSFIPHEMLVNVNLNQIAEGGQLDPTTLPWPPEQSFNEPFVNYPQNLPNPSIQNLFPPFPPFGQNFLNQLNFRFPGLPFNPSPFLPPSSTQSSGFYNSPSN